MIVNTHAAVKGRYTLRVERPGVGVVSETAFDNLITDSGLDHLGTMLFSNVGTGSVVYWSHLGTGTSPPSTTDTSLEAPVANGVARNGSGVTISLGQSRDNFYGEDPPRVRRTVTFTCTYPLGAIVGNLSEVGVGPGTDSTPGELFSRARILDSMGNPTTVTATADDVVVLVYKLTVDFTGKSSGSVTVAGTTYNYETDLSAETAYTGANAATSVYAVNTSGNGPAQGNVGYLTTMSAWVSPSTSYSWAGSSGIATATYAAYTPGDHYRDVTVRLTTGTGSPGIQGLRINRGNTGALSGISWRIRFSAPIPFTSSQQFQVTLRSSWGRA